MLHFQGSDGTRLDIIPALLVDLEDVQAVPPGLGSASEDAGQLLELLLVVLGGDAGCAHLMSWGPGMKALLCQHGTMAGQWASSGSHAWRERLGN